MIKNGISLLAEACMSDDINADSDVNDVIREAKETLTSCMDLDEAIPMTPEMVPIVKHGDFYCVDFTPVYATATDMKADIGNVLNAIIQDNNEQLEKAGSDEKITTENLVVTIESNDYFDEVMQEAKCGGNLGDKAKGTLSKATNTIKSMKKAGIKVAKKKCNK